MPLYTPYVQAGLLTPRSSYLLRLPNHTVSDINAAFVPGYSGGPVPDFHRVSSSLCYEHLNNF